MPTAIVTGSGGLVGSEALSHVGYDVVGLDGYLHSLFGVSKAAAD